MPGPCVRAVQGRRLGGWHSRVVQLDLLRRLMTRRGMTVVKEMDAALGPAYLLGGPGLAPHPPPPAAMAKCDLPVPRHAPTRGAARAAKESQVPRMDRELLSLARAQPVMCGVTSTDPHTDPRSRWSSNATCRFWSRASPTR